ncbi:unnamed protein product [Timema podura]|uniref:Peptidase M14 domain-containing protein n=1 Tax=Timema podura TaxID=61482 RepID=A0ABN7NC21_TIMPD|nr:unnamed protein product [Timema podura]
MLITSGSWAEKARFDNYVVYRLTPTTKNHLDALRILEEEPDGLNFWKSVGPMNSSVDVMVPPHKRADFHDALRNLDLEKEVFIQDVQHLIDSERPSDNPRTDFNWNSYHRIDEIYSWLNSLSLMNPGIVTPIVAGTTYEGRQIRGVKISYKSNNPGVFIEAG